MLADFTLDELARMQRTLRRRFSIDRDPNLIDVGFGVALRANRVDNGRSPAACFFVRRKGKPDRRTRAIPPEVRLRLRRHGQFETIRLATDVVEAGAVAPSGQRFSAPDVGPAMAGTIVIWQRKVARGRGHFCGILTVGHAFSSHRRDLVLIRGRAHGRDFNGRLYLKSRRPSAVDAAIIHVHPEDLVANEILDADLLMDGIVDPAEVADVNVPSPAELATMPGLRGTSFRDGQSQPFLLHALLPTMTIPTLGCLGNVVAVRASRFGAFSPGTSGSAWEIGSCAAAIQVAGTPPAFRHGFGQALAVALTWAREALRQQEGFVRGSLRLVTWV